jgi:ComF family protein
MLRTIHQSLLHLFFPHVCAGCGSDQLEEESQLCLTCFLALPHTDFGPLDNNPVEKVFWGRLPLQSATAAFYYTKGSLMQSLLHQFKYKGHRRLGGYLGQQLASTLRHERFASVDAVVPLPLHRRRERKRGYNQSLVLCEAIADILKVPVLKHCVARPGRTETQTRKNRTERWENMAGRFVVKDPQPLRNKHILLVDDVLTTGATLEACGHALLAVEGLRLSVASLCLASGN